MLGETFPDTSAVMASPPREGIQLRDNNMHMGQHSALKNVSIVDCATLSEVIPNSSPMKLDNEWFSGEVMIMIRTPDVDDRKEPAPTGETPIRISKYLKQYKRRFEFQFQIELKQVPTGPIFLGCEVEEMVKVSRLTKGLAGLVLETIRRINPGLHYSWGVDADSDPEAIEEGRYEKTHLSFPVEQTMDRIVVTKPGEKPPQLGCEIHESNASVKRRRKMGAGSVDWELGNIYTLCLWSSYCDWIQWKALNIPGCYPFSLCSVTGRQPIYLSVYELTGMSPQEYKKKKPPHNRCDLRVYSRLEIANKENTEGGLAPRFRGKLRPIGNFSSVTETDSEISAEA